MRRRAWLFASATPAFLRKAQDRVHASRSGLREECPAFGQQLAVCSYQSAGHVGDVFVATMVSWTCADPSASGYLSCWWFAARRKRAPMRGDSSYCGSGSAAVIAQAVGRAGLRGHAAVCRAHAGVGSARSLSMASPCGLRRWKYCQRSCVRIRAIRRQVPAIVDWISRISRVSSAVQTISRPASGSVFRQAAVSAEVCSTASRVGCHSLERTTRRTSSAASRRQHTPAPAATPLLH